MVIMKVKKSVQTNDDDLADPIEEIPKDILVVAQEVKIVQSLACNDVNKRNKQIRKLRKWLILRAKSSFNFTEDDFLRIWKGLYYNMWMSDKPLVQEDLTEELGKLIECFDDVETAVKFFGAFLRTMCNEWFGIDQWRIDKFLMLVRRMLRYMFRVLRRTNWNTENIELFNQHIVQSVLAQTTATGLAMHFLDIFFEELAKVSEGEIDSQQVGIFIKPFVWFLKTQSDLKLLSHCRSRVFIHLLYQSTLGREYQEKYNAWREMGFPTASINDLEKEESSLVTDDNDVNETSVKADTKHLDPRAGNVDVFMPELPLDGQLVINEIELALKEVTHTKRRKMLRKLLQLFQTYQNGEFPLGVKTMPRFEEKSEKPLIKHKILQLENLENEMFSTGRKLKQMNKRKRRKLLKSLNYADLDETNFEQVIEKSIPKQYLKERKKKYSLLSGWLEEELDSEPPKKLQKTEIKETELKVQQNNGKIKNKAKKNKEQASAQKKEVKLDGKPKNKVSKKPETLDNTVKVGNDCIRNLSLQPAASNITNDTKPSPKITTKISEWDTPLGEGEVEYFIPSRKIQLQKAQDSILTDIVRNPFVKKNSSNTPNRLKEKNKTSTPVGKSPMTPSTIKRVKIALKHNTEQKPHEYIKQIKSSPSLPFDANKKPGKGLLKPNSIPSPINPFYKKKIGLRFLNETA